MQGLFAFFSNKGAVDVVCDDDEFGIRIAFCEVKKGFCVGGSAGFPFGFDGYERFSSANAAGQITVRSFQAASIRLIQNSRFLLWHGFR